MASFPRNCSNGFVKSSLFHPFNMTKPSQHTLIHSITYTDLFVSLILFNLYTIRYGSNSLFLLPLLFVAHEHSALALLIHPYNRIGYTIPSYMLNFASLDICLLFHRLISAPVFLFFCISYPMIYFLENTYTFSPFVSFYLLG